MKIRRLGLLALPLVALITVSCNALGNNGDANTQQLVKVTRGDLTVSVSGSGNVEAVNSSKLTFTSPGQIGRVYVAEGQDVAKGDRIAALVTDSLDMAVSQAGVAVAQAEAALANAEVGVKAAQQALDAALGRPTYTEVETAQTDVDEAKSYVQYVTSNMANAAPAEQQTWATALIYAQSKLAAAQARLNALISNYDTEEVALKRLQVDAAMKSLDLAEQSLKYAQDALDQSTKRLDEATLFAPFDGMVARLNVKEKDSVSPVIVVAEIVDPSRMHLKVQVDEIDVVDVQPGQKARIEVDALPDLTVEGSVDSISLLPASQSGVVVYDARISFKAPEGRGLRPGMSASADIVVAEAKNVILAPDRAIRKNSKGETAVMVMVDGKPREKLVTTGISDGIQTEVLGGLQEGDIVVVERPSQSPLGLF